MKRKPTEIRKLEITIAAMKIIANQGAKHFTAQNVAHEVGISAGAIFRHFINMEDIINAILDYMDSVLFTGFPPDSKDPLKRLQSFFLNRVEVINNHPDVSRLLLLNNMSQLKNMNTVARTKKMRKRSRDFVVNCIQDAEHQGYLSSNISVEAATIIVIGSILALAHNPTRVISDKESLHLAVEVWNGIENLLRCSQDCVEP